MRIETDRLILREYSVEDFEAVHEYGSLPDFSQYEMWGPNSEEDTKKFLLDGVVKARVNPRYEFELGVTLKGDDTVIGGCGLRRDSQHSNIGNMGWAVSPKHQGEGIATEAAIAFLEFGFQELGLVMIYATCDTRNAASYRVMEKIGMKRVGMKVADREIHGKIYDSYRYELLQGDWAANA